jgi:hypothetical protein
LVIAGLVAAIAKVRRCAILIEITGGGHGDTTLSFAPFRGNRGHPRRGQFFAQGALIGRNNPRDMR